LLENNGGVNKMKKNKAMELLHIQYPIIQAPMAGGITTSSLVSSVSNGGGLGMIGAGYMTPIQLREQIREVKQLTPKKFGVNLFIPSPYKETDHTIQSAFDQLQSFRDHLGIEEELPNSMAYSKDIENFNRLLTVIIEEKVPVCSFTFGVPGKEVIKELKKHSIILMGTATNLTESIINQESGMDIVTLQGMEAGGHRGTFTTDQKDSLIGLMPLIPQVADKLTIPIVAAGGIMDGRGLMAALILGAQGVQIGTAFLTCAESGTHPVHKEAILSARVDDTVLTRAFSGKWARGLKNKFIVEMQDFEKDVPDFPVQNRLTATLRKVSAVQNNPDYMSLWSGQAPMLAKVQSVDEFMKKMMEEANSLISSYQANW
jgi:nitronate monooxygenase